MTIHTLQAFSKIVSVLLLLIVLAACSRHTMPSPDSTRRSESAVIVVPGYYGTRLVRDSDQGVVFISLTQSLFGSQALTLPVPGLGFEGTIDLTPDGILDEVRVVPLFYSIDVYGSLLDRLQHANTTSRNVIPFPYDWRGDLMEAVRSLDALIHRLRDKGTQNISVVAHSMGGLIVSYYLRYGTQDVESAVETWEGTEKIQRVVLAGVPFLGVMNTFQNMNVGVKVGFNSSLLSAEAYSSFPSSYYTLPVAETDELLTPELKPISGMIRNAENWEQSKWGLLRMKEPLSKEIMDQRAVYTSFWLQRSRRFLDLIHAPLSRPNPRPLSLLYVYAKGTPTLARGMWTENHGHSSDFLLLEDSDSVESRSAGISTTVYEDGDGTVTIPSAWLPSAYRQVLPTTIREYKVGHTELVRCPDIQRDIITFLDSP